jgi:hypothetical protein
MRFSALALAAMLMAGVYGAHQYVIKQVTSSEPRLALPQAPPLVSGPIDWSKMQVGLPAGMTEDIKRFNAENLDNQIRESQRRMQDMQAFARNPAAWHGMPPH